MFFAATAKRRPIGSTECRLLAATSLAIFALAARDVSAQCSFHGLGGLPNGPANDLAEAYGVSADGRVVVGQARDPNNFPRAVRWTRDEGLVELFDPFIQYSGARAASADGRIIVGWHQPPDPFVQFGFRWSSPDGWFGIGMPSAVSVSADGNVVVGRGTSSGAYRWTLDDGLETLATNGLANAVSADGDVVVGAFGLNYVPRAARWTPDGFYFLGDLNNAQDAYSEAFAVSADGSVIVGEGCAEPSIGIGSCSSSNASKREAFRWTEAEGMIGLGILSTVETAWSGARGVSGDGSIVVGVTTQAAPINVAFIWDAANGMRVLKDVLESDYGFDLDGWTLDGATAISTDGHTIVGYGTNPSGQHEGWVVTIPAPSPRVEWSEPSDGFVDVRQDRSVTGTTRQGASVLRIAFSCVVRDAATAGLVGADSFTVESTSGAPPVVLDAVQVDGTESTFDLVLSDPIPPGAWTTVIAHVQGFNGQPIESNPGDRVTIGFLPADVNRDGTSSPVDILALIDSLNQAVTLPVEQTDVNRSNLATPADILRLIDLLNGANTSRVWNGAMLPPKP